MLIKNFTFMKIINILVLLTFFILNLHDFSYAFANQPPINPTTKSSFNSLKLQSSTNNIKLLLHTEQNLKLKTQEHLDKEIISFGRLKILEKVLGIFLTLLIFFIPAIIILNPIIIIPYIIFIALIIVGLLYLYHAKIEHLKSAGLIIFDNPNIENQTKRSVLQKLAVPSNLTHVFFANIFKIIFNASMLLVFGSIIALFIFNPLLATFLGPIVLGVFATIAVISFSGYAFFSWKSKDEYISDKFIGNDEKILESFTDTKIALQTNPKRRAELSKLEILRTGILGALSALIIFGFLIAPYAPVIFLAIATVFYVVSKNQGLMDIFFKKKATIMIGILSVLVVAIAIALTATGIIPMPIGLLFICGIIFFIGMYFFYKINRDDRDSRLEIEGLTPQDESLQDSLLRDDKRTYMHEQAASLYKNRIGYSFMGILVLLLSASLLWIAIMNPYVLIGIGVSAAIIIGVILLIKYMDNNENNIIKSIYSFIQKINQYQNILYLIIGIIGISIIVAGFFASVINPLFLPILGVMIISIAMIGFIYFGQIKASGNSENNIISRYINRILFNDGERDMQSVNGSRIVGIIIFSAIFAASIFAGLSVAISMSTPFLWPVIIAIVLLAISFFTLQKFFGKDYQNIFRVIVPVTFFVIGVVLLISGIFFQPLLFIGIALISLGVLFYLSSILSDRLRKEDDQDLIDDLSKIKVIEKSDLKQEISLSKILLFDDDFLKFADLWASEIYKKQSNLIEQDMKDKINIDFGEQKNNLKKLLVASDYTTTNGETLYATDKFLLDYYKFQNNFNDIANIDLRRVFQIYHARKLLENKKLELSNSNYSIYKNEKVYPIKKTAILNNGKYYIRRYLLEDSNKYRAKLEHSNMYLTASDLMKDNGFSSLLDQLNSIGCSGYEIEDMLNIFIADIARRNGKNVYLVGQIKTVNERWNVVDLEGDDNNEFIKQDIESRIINHFGSSATFTRRNIKLYLKSVAGVNDDVINLALDDLLAIKKIAKINDDIFTFIPDERGELPVRSVQFNPYCNEPELNAIRMINYLRGSRMITLEEVIDFEKDREKAVVIFERLKTDNFIDKDGYILDLKKDLDSRYDDNIRKMYDEKRKTKMLVFGELALNGYSQGDFVESVGYMDRIKKAALDLENAAKKLKIGIVYGRTLSNDLKLTGRDGGKDRYIGLKVFVDDVSGIKKVDHAQKKVCLPTYGEYDEYRNNSPGAVNECLVESFSNIELKEDDFSGLQGKIDLNTLMTNLKQAGYLDEKNHLTDKFLQLESPENFDLNTIINSEFNKDFKKKSKIINPLIRIDDINNEINNPNENIMESNKNLIWKILRKNVLSIGFQICEDGWVSRLMPADDRLYPGMEPVESLILKGADVIVNLSASPLYFGKLAEITITESFERWSYAYQTPLLYTGIMGVEVHKFGGGYCFNGNGETTHLTDLSSESSYVVDLKNLSSVPRLDFNNPKIAEKYYYYARLEPEYKENARSEEKERVEFLQYYIKDIAMKNGMYSYPDLEENKLDNRFLGSYLNESLPEIQNKLLHTNLKNGFFLKFTGDLNSVVLLDAFSMALKDLNSQGGKIKFYVEFAPSFENKDFIDEQSEFLDKLILENKNIIRWDNLEKDVMVNTISREGLIVVRSENQLDYKFASIDHKNGMPILTGWTREDLKKYEHYCELENLSPKYSPRQEFFSVIEDRLVQAISRFYERGYGDMKGYLLNDLWIDSLLKNNNDEKIKNELLALSENFSNNKQESIRYGLKKLIALELARLSHAVEATKGNRLDQRKHPMGNMKSAGRKVEFAGDMALYDLEKASKILLEEVEKKRELRSLIISNNRDFYKEIYKLLPNFKTNFSILKSFLSLVENKYDNPVNLKIFKSINFAS